MPTLARWFIRTALACFITALLLGAVMQTRSAVAAFPALAVAWPGYLHLLMVGWITGLIMGVAYWLFPRPDRNRPPPPDAFGWTAYGCLYLGLLLRLPAEPATAMNPVSPLRWLLPVSGLLQLIAAVAFVALIWPRVRSR
jgi:hypothetical protein